MIKINIYCVGSLREEGYKLLFNEYSKRLKRFCDFKVIEVKEEVIQNSSPEAVKNKEAESLLKLINDKDEVVLIDLHGKELDSLEFAKTIDNYKNNGVSPVDFVIAGTLGYGEKMIARADKRVCLSKMTFAHQMVRVILAEQIYRGFKINNHEEYHH